MGKSEKGGEERVRPNQTSQMQAQVREQVQSLFHFDTSWTIKHIIKSHQEENPTIKEWETGVVIEYDKIRIWWIQDRSDKGNEREVLRRECKSSTYH